MRTKMQPFAAFPLGDPAARRNMLIYKMIAIHFIGITLLFLAYQVGWVHASIAADSSRIVFLITLYFLGGVFLTTKCAVEISKELNRLKEFDPKNEYPEHSDAIRHLALANGADPGSRAIIYGLYKDKLLAHVSTSLLVSNLLVIFGLIGTVVGFIMSLQGNETMDFGDTEVIKKFIGVVFKGAGVALYTTLVGAVFSVWIIHKNHVVIKSARNLAHALGFRGEVLARANREATRQRALEENDVGK